jgi:NDP-sugar pyrophosphorylase family protein
LLAPTDFFDLHDPVVAGFFVDCDYVWQALSGLEDRVQALTEGRQTILGDVMPGAYLSDRPIFIAKTARIEPGAYVHGPAYIGEGAVVRHGAFVRENVVMLPGSILGHASEAKHSLMLPNAHAPHFNYVGDSILGQHVNLGAGTKLSNLTLVSAKDPETGKRPTLELYIEDENYDTGLAKLGAILGDNTQTGCNAVLNPGSLVGKDSLIYANLSLRKGYYPANSIIKLRQKIVVIQRRSGN